MAVVKPDCDSGASTAIDLMLSILHRYVFRLWLAPFLIMFILINTVFLIQKVTIWLPKLVEHEASLNVIVMLFASQMPLDLTMTIPISFFFALIKLVSGLQANSELDAMFAGGRSLINIFAPIFWAGIALTVVMFWLTMELVPAGKVMSFNIASKLAASNSAPSFEPKMFITDIEDMVFYYDGKNPDGTYAHFMLTDLRSKGNGTRVYFANKASISHVNEGLLVRLFQGSELVGEKENIRSTYFSNYDIVVPLEDDSKYHTINARAGESFMGTKELWQVLSQDNPPVSYVAHWHFRLVLALSVLVLFFYAIPISLRVKRAKQGGIFLWAVLVMWTINQTELVLFKKIELGVLPWWSLWAVWLGFMAVGLWLFHLVQKRGSVSFRLGKRKKV